jgi:hypothetical protein
LPNPSLDLGTVRRHLDDLTIPAGVAEDLRLILGADPEESLKRQLGLVDRTVGYLGGP